MGLINMRIPHLYAKYPIWNLKISADADGGPRSRVCACGTLSSPPPPLYNYFLEIQLLFIAPILIKVAPFSIRGY